MTRALGAGAIGAAAALAVLHAAWLAASVHAGNAAAVALGLALGALAADAVTGLVHWACDTWGSDQTPLVGSTLIAGFREHHADPRAMLAHDWVAVNREPALAAAAALALFALGPLQRGLAAYPGAYAFLLGLAVFGAAANQLHLWAHAERPPRLARGLQRLGLVLTPARHARHHRGACTSDYCISTGWLNPALDGLGFWRGLERAIERRTGAVARAADAAPEEQVEWPPHEARGMDREIGHG